MHKRNTLKKTRKHFYGIKFIFIF